MSKASIIILTFIMCRIFQRKSYSNYYSFLLLFVILIHHGCNCIVLRVSSTLNSSMTCSEKFSCSLDYYANHFPDQDNAILLLDDGTHYLHSSIVLFEGLRNLSIVGNSGSSMRMSSENLFKPATKIQCIGMSGFVFSHVQDLNIP